MVDRQERLRMGEILEREGAGDSPYEGQRAAARAGTPRPDDDGGGGKVGGNTRGTGEGFGRRSGSGRSVGGAARKEVRWSKDVDYEG